MLEVSWEVLENVGLVVEKLVRSWGGVFIGISSGDYVIISGNFSNMEIYYGIGNVLSIVVNWLFYFLDWCGLSWVVDIVCFLLLVVVY